MQLYTFMHNGSGRWLTGDMRGGFEHVHNLDDADWFELLPSSLNAVDYVRCSTAGVVVRLSE